jgi:hypothetical protein
MVLVVDKNTTTITLYLQIFTFDDYGVSGHINHIAPHRAVREMLQASDHRLKGQKHVFILFCLACFHIHSYSPSPSFSPHCLCGNRECLWRSGGMPASIARGFGVPALPGTMIFEFE